MHGKKQHFWIDRRDDRVNANLMCQVGPQQDTLDTAQILNLSIGGLKFSCTEETVARLLPEDQRTPGLVSDVIIQLRFQLPLPGRKKPALINSSASVIHSERLAQDNYHIGVRFQGLSDTERKSIMAYIEDNKEQAGNP
ncbi:MAG: PilZ domain-containing protein [Gammaproteobacteria bacterium]|nr:PilZ domain-containing protein [Gammaproteobacteria bacterium]